VLKISVISPSVRKAGLKVVARSLERQSFPQEDWEWIIVSPFDPEIFSMDKNWYWIEDPPKNKGDYWNLNKAYNAALRKAEGQLIISWQDWLWAKEDALEKFWFWFKEKGDKWAVTGSGHQYQRLDEFGKPIIQIWTDPRRSNATKNGGAYECSPIEWEINFASAPRKAFYDIGGFDEGLDKMAGMDNVSICERMDELGYRFWIDHGLECRGIKHGRLPEWDKMHAMHGFYEQRKKELKLQGKWPVLGYL